VIKVKWLASMVVALTAVGAQGSNAPPPNPVAVLGGIPHEALFAIDFDGQTGVAVGAGGEIVRTTDGGASWTRESAPRRLALLGVAVRGEHAIAVGQMGVVLVRGADGRWSEVDSGTEERLFGVDLNAHGVALAVGAFGALLRSADGGRSWSAAAPEWAGIFKDTAGRLGDFFEPSLYGVQLADDGRAWAVGELALVLRSTDAGASWQVGHAGESRVDGVDPTLFGFSMRDDGSGVAVLVSDDGGVSWRTTERPTHANLLSVHSSADGVVVATGMRELLFSRDGGANWQPVRGEDIATGWYSGAARPGGGGAPLVVGNAGRILRLQM
jgi:photosystem II stability/assembly factor-like uncharacterized protein